MQKETNDSSLFPCDIWNDEKFPKKTIFKIIKQTHKEACFKLDNGIEDPQEKNFYESLINLQNLKEDTPYLLFFSQKNDSLYLELLISHKANGISDSLINYPINTKLDVVFDNYIKNILNDEILCPGYSIEVPKYPNDEDRRFIIFTPCTIPITESQDIEEITEWIETYGKEYFLKV